MLALLAAIGYGAADFVDAAGTRPETSIVYVGSSGQPRRIGVRAVRNLGRRAARVRAMP